MRPDNPINAKKSSGNHLSYWIDSAEALAYTKINSDKETDVLIIGGGIAGLSTAYCLTKAGRKVVLLEDGYLGSGETGRTTAQITYALDDRYYDLEKFFGKEKTAMAAQSHKYALEWINDTVEAENIDCNFMRVDGYLFPDPTDKEANLVEEYETMLGLNIPVEMLTQIPGFKSGSVEKCIKFPKQGQFHIIKYLKGLADAVIKMGGEIYTESKAIDITDKGASSNGYFVKANHIVVATNSPVINKFTMHTKQWAYRTYVIAAKVPKGILPYAMWWDTGNQNSPWVAKPYHYVRLEPLNDEYDLLISGGEDHKTGMAEQEKISEEDRYKSLTEWTQKYFPYFSRIEYKWSGQVIEPVDSMAFIGKNPGDDNIYIITGDSGNGMTHGTIGGILITDIITGNKNAWEELYNPSRINLKTGEDYIREVGSMTFEAVKDWLSSDLSNAYELKNGEGGIITSGLKKIAVYKDDSGKITACSAVCPHLGGVLKWNNDEKSFDCPLHGSRFTPYGEVINGPAISNLKKAE